MCWTQPYKCLILIVFLTWITALISLPHAPSPLQVACSKMFPKSNIYRHAFVSLARTKCLTKLNAFDFITVTRRHVILRLRHDVPCLSTLHTPIDNITLPPSSTPPTIPLRSSRHSLHRNVVVITHASVKRFVIVDTDYWGVGEESRTPFHITHGISFYSSLCE